MADSTPRRARTLFDRAAALPPSEREGFVRRECGNDHALLGLVLDLLKHEGATLPLSAAPTGSVRAGP